MLRLYYSRNQTKRDRHVESERAHRVPLSELGQRRIQAVKSKGIYVLPNAFTAAALFAAFYGIIQAMNGDFGTAAVAVFFSMLFDGMDGRVARLTHTQSEFGVQMDSLADAISFGVAPRSSSMNTRSSTSASSAGPRPSSTPSARSFVSPASTATWAS